MSQWEKETRKQSHEWGEDIVQTHGFNAVREAVVGKVIEVISGASLTYYSKHQKKIEAASIGGTVQYAKGTADFGANLLITDVRSGARNSFILVCEPGNPFEFNMSVSGKQTITNGDLGVEITARDMPIILASPAVFMTQIEDWLRHSTDPRFEDTPEEPAINTDELAAEGFGAW